MNGLNIGVIVACVIVIIIIVVLLGYYYWNKLKKDYDEYLRNREETINNSSAMAVDGPDGTDGKSAFQQWKEAQLSGIITPPSSTLGVTGDYYFDISDTDPANHILWGPKIDNMTWPATSIGNQAAAETYFDNLFTGTHGIAGNDAPTAMDGGDGDDGSEGDIGEAGLDGSKGPDGEVGETGIDGDTFIMFDVENREILRVNSDGPALTDGFTGDYYLDTTGSLLYGPKLNDNFGDWPMPYLAITIIGTGSPNGVVPGVPNDYFYDTDTGDLYGPKTSTDMVWPTTTFLNNPLVISPNNFLKDHPSSVIYKVGSSQIDIDYYYKGSFLCKILSNWMAVTSNIQDGFVSYILYNDDYDVIGITGPFTLEAFNNISTSDTQILNTYILGASMDIKCRVVISLNKGGVMSSFTSEILEPTLKETPFIFKRTIDTDPFVNEFYNIINGTPALEKNQVEFLEMVKISEAVDVPMGAGSANIPSGGIKLP